MKRSDEGMKIAGLQKLSLLDYPGKMAATVFTGGCNLRCPFCHNAPLVVGDGGGDISEEELFRFLEKRTGILEGVCVTGGEPLLHKETPELLARIKALGYFVKLDTNGTFPDLLEKVIDSGNVDFVAMDIKNCPAKYAETVGVAGFCTDGIMRSVKLLMENRVMSEFRTTVSATFHTDDDMLAIGEWLHGARRYVIQAFSDKGNLIDKNVVGYDENTLRKFAEMLKNHFDEVIVRGI